MKPFVGSCQKCEAPRYVRGQVLCAICATEARPAGTAMPASESTPVRAATAAEGPDTRSGHADGGCATCSYWNGWVIHRDTEPPHTRHLSGCGCSHRYGPFQALPRTGCVFWVREIGADDVAFDWGRIASG